MIPCTRIDGSLLLSCSRTVNFLAGGGLGADVEADVCGRFGADTGAIACDVAGLGGMEALDDEGASPARDLLRGGGAGDFARIAALDAGRTESLFVSFLVFREASLALRVFPGLISPRLLDGLLGGFLIAPMLVERGLLRGADSEDDGFDGEAAAFDEETTTFDGRSRSSCFLTAGSIVLRILYSIFCCV